MTKDKTPPQESTKAKTPEQPEPKKQSAFDELFADDPMMQQVRKSLQQKNEKPPLTDQVPHPNELRREGENAGLRESDAREIDTHVYDPENVKFAKELQADLVEDGRNIKDIAMDQLPAKVQAELLREKTAQEKLDQRIEHKELMDQVKNAPKFESDAIESQPNHTALAANEAEIPKKEKENTPEGDNKSQSQDKNNGAEAESPSQEQKAGLDKLMQRLKDTGMDFKGSAPKGEPTPPPTTPSGPAGDKNGPSTTR